VIGGAIVPHLAAIVDQQHIVGVHCRNAANADDDKRGDDDSQRPRHVRADSICIRMEWDWMKTRMWEIRLVKYEYIDVVCGDVL
jgi:hypothetical protein